MEISQATHDVENQAPPLAPYNVFEADLALREAVEREGGGWGVDRMRDTGQRIVVMPKTVVGWHMTPTHYLSQDLVDVWLDR